jgi:peroxiredoxin Q/BCP
MTNDIATGDTAPQFTLDDEGGNAVTLAAFRGKQPVLLIFYPGDDTPGCTKQLCAIRDDQQAFKERGVAVFGVNHAGTASHAEFIEKHQLTTPLLIDEGMTVSALYGATKKFFGKAIISRSVVLVDKEGVIRYLKRGLPPDSEILAAIDAL